MSQRSSDVPMLVNISIYFPNIFSELAGTIQIIKSPLSTMLFQCQKLLTYRNCLNILMFLQGEAADKGVSIKNRQRIWLKFHLREVPNRSFSCRFDVISGIGTKEWQHEVK